MADGPTGSRSMADGLKVHACSLCQRRKVKCDRRVPCASCSKAKVDCEYKDPLPPRRRKKQDSGTLAARIRHYENALQKAGINVSSIERDDSRMLSTAGTVNSDDNHSTKTSQLVNASISEKTLESPRHVESLSQQGPGRLVTRKGRSLYLDNHLWKSVTNELQDAGDILPEEETPSTSAEPRKQLAEELNSSFIFGGVNSRQSLTQLHPNAIQIFQLWNTFIEGVNPLTKIVHVPTLQQELLNAASDLSSLSPEMEALMFSIYSSALLCMQVDEVQKYFKEPKSTLLTKYRQCAQQALVNAGILATSDLRVLQAFVLFILSVRMVYDPHTLWSLTGICVRIAQRIGLHKDGSQLGLSVFETEMRRRLWWNLTVVDATIGHMAGCESHMLLLADTQLPGNYNDSALDADMKEIPDKSSGPTEMFFCLMSYDLGVWLTQRSKHKTSSFEGLWEFLSSTTISIEEKDRMIDELEQLFDRKYIRYCDPAIPLHFQTFVVAKSVVLNTRMRVHHPRQYQEKGQPIPPAEMDLLFRLCMTRLENSELILGAQKVAKFRWHLDFHFPWDALIVTLLIVRQRKTGPEVARAWQLLDVVFKRQEKLLNRSNKRSPLHLAIANLAIKAWSAHLTETERHHVEPLPQPETVKLLLKYTQRTKPTTSIEISSSAPPPSSPSPPLVAQGISEHERTKNAERATRNSDKPHETTAQPDSLQASTEWPGREQDATNLYNNNTERDASNQLNDMNDTNFMELGDPFNGSPFDWDQWDAMLHEFKDFGANDMEILLQPST